jgi:hypothetical protein
MISKVMEAAVPTGLAGFAELLPTVNLKQCRYSTVFHSITHLHQLYVDICIDEGVVCSGMGLFLTVDH